MQFLRPLTFDNFRRAASIEYNGFKQSSHVTWAQSILKKYLISSCFRLRAGWEAMSFELRNPIASTCHIPPGYGLPSFGLNVLGSSPSFDSTYAMRRMKS